MNGFQLVRRTTKRASRWPEVNFGKDGRSAAQFQLEGFIFVQINIINGRAAFVVQPPQTANHELRRVEDGAVLGKEVCLIYH